MRHRHLEGIIRPKKKNDDHRVITTSTLGKWWLRVVIELIRLERSDYGARGIGPVPFAHTGICTFDVHVIGDRDIKRGSVVGSPLADCQFWSFRRVSTCFSRTCWSVLWKNTFTMVVATMSRKVHGVDSDGSFASSGWSESFQTSHHECLVSNVPLCLCKVSEGRADTGPDVSLWRRVCANGLPHMLHHHKNLGLKASP